MSKTKEITIETGRVFVFPDLHGCYDQFMSKLDELDFNFDEDKAILLGDLVDRGPKSLDCFNLIFSSWTEVIKGNHEQFAYYALFDQLDKQNHCTHGGEWFYRLPEDVQLAIAKTVDDLPITLTLNRKGKRYGFIHGDFPTIAKTWDHLNKLLESDFLGDQIEQICVWGRSCATSKSQIKCTIKGIDHVYLGHTVFQTPRTTGNMTFLDCGLVFKDVPGYGKLEYIEL